MFVENIIDWSCGILQRSDKAIETITFYNGMETYILYSQAPLQACSPTAVVMGPSLQ